MQSNGNTFGERLAILRESVGISQEVLAKLTGVSANVIDGYETEYIEPRIGFLTRVAQIFGVSLAYAAMLTDDPSVEEDDSVREVYVAGRLHPGGVVRKSDIAGTVYIKKEDTHGRDCYALIMPDDSLERARIRKGDVLIVRKQSRAENGDIVVAEVGERIFVRRYEKVGSIVLLKAESARFDTVKIDLKEQEFSVLGRIDEVRIRNL